jgi:cystathionine beta-lyase
MKRATRLAQRGRRAAAARTVNLPVTRASTVVFDSVAEMEAVQRRFEADEVVPTYGITNMPLRAAFEEIIADLEGGYRACTFPSGLPAVPAAEKHPA